MTHALFDPITLRGVEIRNRIWVAPMCQYQIAEHDGVPRDWHLVHLGALAQGGAGVATVEATGVVPEGRITPDDLGLWNDRQRDAFGRIVGVIHGEGAKASIQLAHAGRKASTWRAWGERREGTVPPEQGGWQPVGASAVAYPGLATPEALDVAGIHEVVGAFAAAARRAVDAGFDLVELHGAHGYLVHEFLSPRSNRRDDVYGGDFAHRIRFLIEIVDAVRAEIGDAVPIVVRLSATDWIDGGWTLDESIALASTLRTRGVDLISVSTGGNEPASIPAGPGYQVPFATAIKDGAGVPVGVAGLITEPFQAEQIVSLGQSDVVYLARELLRDAKWPIRSADELRYDLAYRPRQYERAYR